MKSKNCDVAFKFDISKAYDKIDWGYLKDVLATMEFI